MRLDLFREEAGSLGGEDGAAVRVVVADNRPAGVGHELVKEPGGFEIRRVAGLEAGFAIRPLVYA